MGGRADRGLQRDSVGLECQGPNYAREVEDLYDQFSAGEIIRRGRARFKYDDGKEAPQLPWQQGSLEPSLKDGVTHPSSLKPDEQHVFVQCWLATPARLGKSTGSSASQTPWAIRYAKRTARRGPFLAWRSEAQASSHWRGLAARRRRSLLLLSLGAWLKALIFSRSQKRRWAAFEESCRQRVKAGAFGAWRAWVTRQRIKQEWASIVTSWRDLRARRTAFRCWCAFVAHRRLRATQRRDAAEIWATHALQGGLRRWVLATAIGRWCRRRAEQLSVFRDRQRISQATSAWREATRFAASLMASARTFWAARRVRETFKRWKAYILARVLNADRLKVAEGWRASRLLLVSMATLSSYVHIRREKEIDNHVAWEHSARLRMRRFLDAWRCQAELERRVRAAGDIREARRRAAVLVAWSLEARKGSAAAQAAADYRRLRTSFNGMLCHWWPRHLSAVLLAARQRRQRLEALHGWRDVAWRLRAEAVALRARADALLCAAVWSEWRSMACGAQHPREGKLHRGSRPSCPAATTGPNGLTLLKVLRRSKPQASSEDANAGVSASPIRTPAMQRVLAAMG